MTSDKDFGELIFRAHLNRHGVVLLRMEELTVAERLARLQADWSVIEANPSGQFIVITEKEIRIWPLIQEGDEPARTDPPWKSAAETHEAVDQLSTVPVVWHHLMVHTASSSSYQCSGTSVKGWISPPPAPMPTMNFPPDASSR